MYLLHLALRMGLERTNKPLVPAPQSTGSDPPSGQRPGLQEDTGSVQKSSTFCVFFFLKGFEIKYWKFPTRNKKGHSSNPPPTKISKLTYFQLLQTTSIQNQVPI